MGKPAEQMTAWVAGTGRWQEKAQGPGHPVLEQDTEQAPQLTSWALSPSHKGKATRSLNSDCDGWHLPPPPVLFQAQVSIPDHCYSLLMCPCPAPCPSTHWP